jgi:hypothetical protein
MHKNLLTLSQISLLVVFGAMFGFSMYALYNINTGVLALRLAWPWLLCLLVSAVGLLFLARDLK